MKLYTIFNKKDEKYLEIHGGILNLWGNLKDSTFFNEKEEVTIEIIQLARKYSEKDLTVKTYELEEIDEIS